MKKYIDADRLKELLDAKYKEFTEKAKKDCPLQYQYMADGLDIAEQFIDSLQQEQPNDIRTEIEEYYGEDLALEDERTKAAYHFFSAGKAFELREYEEEREKHITDLLDNFQKGMNAGYEKAISELKEGKVECSPVMKELIDKLFGIGNTFNFGFGPKNIQQEQPVEGLDVTDFCKPIDPGIAKCVANHWWELLDDENAADKKAVKEIVKTVRKKVTRQVKEMVGKQPVEGRLEMAARQVWESWNGGTMDDVRRDMKALGNVLNAKKEE